MTAAVSRLRTRAAELAEVYVTGRATNEQRLAAWAEWRAEWARLTPEEQAMYWEAL